MLKGGRRDKIYLHFNYVSNLKGSSLSEETYHSRSQFAMSLHCPFCHAMEDGRVEASDGEGNPILLVMFSCPFNYKFVKDELGSDDSMQKVLDSWRATNGEDWLESLGPVMKARELKNIERSRAGSF
jgi:hypothetical protein